VLYEALQKENLANEQDLDLDDITNGHARCPAPYQKGKTPEDPNSIEGLSLKALQEEANQVITYEWVRSHTSLPCLLFFHSV
jgi:RAD54-like protein 2